MPVLSVSVHIGFLSLRRSHVKVSAGIPILFAATAAAVAAATATAIAPGLVFTAPMLAVAGSDQ